MNGRGKNILILLPRPRLRSLDGRWIIVDPGFRKLLDSLLPEWQDSVAISLLSERESLAWVTAMIPIRCTLPNCSAALIRPSPS